MRCQAALALAAEAPAGTIEPHLEATACAAAGEIATRRGEHARAIAHHERALALAEQHESRAGFYRLQRRARRSIANAPVPVGWREVNLGRERHVAPAGEMVHASALERLGREVRLGGRAVAYAPPSLIAVLDDIAATYGAGPAGGAGTGRPIWVADWSGEPLDPAAAGVREGVLQGLQAARRRLEAAPAARR